MLKQSLSRILWLVAGGALVYAGMLLGSSDHPSTRMALAAQQARVVQATTASPPLIQYQGRLLDPSTGQLKPDGAYQMTFSLYDVSTGGAPLWTETKSINVSKGLFATLLGDTAALNLAAFDGRDLFLGVTVGGDPEATPRQRISHVAYAIRAENADTLDGIDSSGLAAVAHTHNGADIVDASLPLAKLDGAGVAPGQVIAYDGTNAIWTTPATDGLLGAHVFVVNCQSVASFGTTPTKVTDVGSFTKQDDDSMVEVDFHGRLYAGSLASSNAAVFELRIDNSPTSMGWARTMVKAAEVGGGGGGGIEASMSGIFSGLAAGPHTLSVWVYAANSGGSGTDAFIDPGCFSTAHFVVKELK